MNTCQRFAGCKNRIHHKQVNTATWKLTQSRQLVKRFIVMAYEHQSLCCSTAPVGLISTLAWVDIYYTHRCTVPWLTGSQRRR